MARSRTKKLNRETEAQDVEPKRYPLALTVIGLLYLTLAIAYNFVIPAGTVDQHNADENAHVLYVQALALGHLPVFTAGSNAYENHQPPLYYLLCLPLYFAYKALDPSAYIHALRFVSTFMGALMLYVVYKTSALLFPGKTVLNTSVAAFASLLPMNVNLNASVTNDSLTNLMVALGVWQGVKIVVQPKESLSNKWVLGQSIVYGLILGAGILTKTSTVLLFPFALVIYTLAARRGLLEGNVAFRGAITTMFLGLIIGAPWLLRNQMLYGDPVAQSIFQKAFVNTAQADVIIRGVFQGDIGAYFGAVAKWTFASYWGVFDSMRLFWGQAANGSTPFLTAPLNPIYDAILGVIGLSLAGLVVLLVKKPAYITPAVGVSLSAFTCLIFLTALVFLRFILSFFQAQGRYLYPSLVPLTVLFWLGLFAWSDKTLVQRIVSFLVIIGLLALNAYTLAGLLLPRFSAQDFGQV